MHNTLINSIYTEDMGQKNTYIVLYIIATAVDLLVVTNNAMIHTLYGIITMFLFSLMMLACLR